MDGDHWIVLRLEVDRDSDPIIGTLIDDDKDGRPFTGWLGLTDAIEEVRASHGEPPPQINTHKRGMT